MLTHGDRLNRLEVIVILEVRVSTEENRLKTQSQQINQSNKVRTSNRNYLSISI
jgi:hypothetical protein